MAWDLSQHTLKIGISQENRNWSEKQELDALHIGTHHHLAGLYLTAAPEQTMTLRGGTS